MNDSESGPIRLERVEVDPWYMDGMQVFAFWVAITLLGAAFGFLLGSFVSIVS